MIDPRSTRAYKLEKENKELKKEIEVLRNGNDITKIINDNVVFLRYQREQQEEIERLNKEVNKYKSRCKKAIEYLLKNKLYCFKYDDEELFEITTDKKAKDDLLNILQGSNEPSFEEMVNFVENVYQDIKNQSTLDEELEEERERIAKIVDDFKGADKE